ncbi:MULTISPECIES: glycosyltransferase [unclassified Clostridium]|uniref:glycosyltransferase n=1 Tax=unclassified Clostridium TaxID=2614128 RepID=UPI001106CD5D|nr:MULTISPECIES: glycosyltransferase [unclassified Clostridium]
MKIAFFIGSLRRGGAERVISILANHYARRGWQVDILLLLENQCGYELESGVRLVDCTVKGTSYGARMPRWLGRIRAYVKRDKPDRVVSFIGRINGLVLAACLGLRVPIIVSERNDPKRDGRGALIRWGCNLLYPKARAVVFQNEHERACFSRGIRRKGRVIPNPVSVTCAPGSADGWRIVTAGRLVPQKNQRLLLEAFARLRRELPQCTLTLYGDGPLGEALTHQARELGIESAVELAGNVTDLHQRIAGARLFVMASDFEGLSNALLEAMMLGLACVSTKYDGVEEVIKQEESGLLVPVGDANALAAAMLRVLRDPALEAKLRAGALKTAEQYRAERVLDLWDEVIS